MMLEAQKVLHQLIAHEAVIDMGRSNGVFPAYPRGDRRKRPICWLDNNMLKHLFADDVLERRASSFIVKSSAKHRNSNMKNGSEHAAQHRDIEDCDVYIPDGVIRQARINRRSTVSYSLRNLRNLDGTLVFTAAEMNAADCLQQDFARAGYGNINTQNFMTTGTDGTRNPDQAHERMAQRMDASKRYKAALDAVGSGLSRAITAICTEGLTLEELERVEGWARRSGRTILKLGLERLTVFYGTL